MRGSRNREESQNSSADGDDASLLKRLKIGHEDLSPFKPGAIVKLRLKNFVTYALGEFCLSPSLNMVVGPNGSGKSTFVCGVCLGLAGKPEYIGRSKKVEDFIKNGETSSIIETTLKVGPEEQFKEYANQDLTTKITRVITRNVKKSTYFLNDRPVEESVIKRLVSDLNIQLDNLCQFLSQERVQDFSKLRSDKLLVETIRSVDVKMVEIFEDLKNLQSEEIDRAKELSIKESRYTELNANRESLEASVRTLESFRQKKRDLAIHEKLLPYAKVKDHKQRIQVYKKNCETAKLQLRSLLSDKKPFKNTLERVQKECEGKLLSKSKLECNFKNTKEIYSTYVERLNQFEVDIKRSQEAIKHYEGHTGRIRKKIEETKQHLREQEQLLTSLKEPDENELEHITMQRTNVSQAIVDINVKLRELSSEAANVRLKISSLKTSTEDKMKSLKSDDKIKVFEGKGPNFNDIRNAVMYVRSKPEMAGRVLEPPVMTVSAKQPQYANYIWNCVGHATSVALTMVDAEAYDQFNNEILREYGVNLRQLTTQELRSPYSLSQLKQMGFDGYLSDLLSGDSRVIKMLCQVSKLHTVPYSLNPLSAKQRAWISRPNVKGDPTFRKFYVGNECFDYGRSHHGDKSIYSNNSFVKNQSFYKGTSLSDERRNEILGQITLLQEDTRNNELKLDQILTEIRESKEECELKKGVDQSLRKKASHISGQRTAITRTKHIIKTLQEKVESLTRESTRDVAAKIKTCQKNIKKSTEDRIECLAEIVTFLRDLQNIEDEVMAATVAYIEAFNSERSMNDVIGFFNEKESKLQEEYEEAKRNYASMKETPEYQSWLGAIRRYSTSEKQQLAALAEEYQSSDNFNLAFVLQVINRLRSEIAMVNEDESVLEILRRTESELSVLNNSIPQLRTSLADLRSQIQEKHSLLEPFLDSIVHKLSSNFSELFKNAGSAGAVQLERPTLYSDWQMNIMVKFRDNAPLKKLDFHTQSGGEKAVSTVLYMVALQEFTSAPFRIVDEINQGMDSKNERIVHKAIVQNACVENTSQYILITPKLLTNLYYHENVRIHCVMAGAWMPNPSAEPYRVHFGRSSAYVF
ncbi:LAME_0A06150g1_1 [Lachancea meyersii CBS 8951]|uniref:Structural maintenance of chromosomes protein 5 n=1 Tax=Lachancea meyersii CBS 8951 TaxID=1266667 RepID=A0A1G4IQ68_9SACH|nr:LAME_0A06150g1_1 [Lachancea meyersii CBS 8951]